MRKVKFVFASLWLILVGLISPLWVGGIYMNITGHGKGYSYNMGAEADISVACGIAFLLLWLTAVLPPLCWVCKKCYFVKKAWGLLPIAVFMALFIVGVLLIGWDEFIKLFGFGYSLDK